VCDIEGVDVAPASSATSRSAADRRSGALDEHPHLAENAKRLSERGDEPTPEFAWRSGLILDGLDWLRRTASR
jgi:hypothetical protein